VKLYPITKNLVLQLRRIWLYDDERISLVCSRASGLICNHHPEANQTHM